MIEHIVLIRWKPDATETHIMSGLDALRRLPDQIPEIVSLICAADFTGRAQGYTHALIARFADRAALDVYGAHPAHLAVIENNLKPILADVIEFDFLAAEH